MANLLEDIHLAAEIEQLKQEREAVILAHVYQPPEIQEIADFTGDSFALSRQAAATKAKVIVFCGVHFMAETANILAPDKITLLPAKEAGCLMFDDQLEGLLRQKIAQQPEAVVISYVNTPAAVKALSDICCTSANAVQVVKSVPADRNIIFVPDRNLASYAEEKTGRNIYCWPGACPAHGNLTVTEILDAKRKHPEALVLMHPECPAEVRALADYIGSTAGIIEYASQSLAAEFIVVTECGVLYQLERCCSGKKFYMASAKLFCSNMKKTTLRKVRDALQTLEPKVVVPEEIRCKAEIGLRKMLEICE